MDEDKNTPFGGKEYIGKPVKVFRKLQVQSKIEHGVCTEITTSGVLIEQKTEKGTIYRKIPWSSIDSVEYLKKED